MVLQPDFRGDSDEIFPGLLAVPFVSVWHGRRAAWGQALCQLWAVAGGLARWARTWKEGDGRMDDKEVLCGWTLRDGPRLQE